MWTNPKDTFCHFMSVVCKRLSHMIPDKNPLDKDDAIDDVQSI